MKIEPAHIVRLVRICIIDKRLKNHPQHRVKIGLESNAYEDRIRIVNDYRPIIKPINLYRTVTEIQTQPNISVGHL